MSTQHDRATPGPWRHAGRGHIWARDHTSQHETSVVQIAVVGAFHDSELLPFNRRRWTADAHLIAAAPALLEALEKAQAVEDHQTECLFCLHDDDCVDLARLRADAGVARVDAIAAARRSPAADGDAG